MTTLTWPALPRIKAATMAYKHPAVVNKTVSGRVQASDDGPSVLTFKIDVNRGTPTADDDSELRPLWAFLLRCRGQIGRFDIVIPKFSYGHGPAVSNGTASVATESGYQVPTVGWPANTVVRKAGDFIQFGLGTRAYPLAQDLVSNASGAATAHLALPLIKSVAAASPAVVNGVTFRCMLDSNTANIAASAGGVQVIKSIGVEEVINA